MEFAIPISRFDATKVKWAPPRTGPFRKTIPFLYEEDNLSIGNLIVSMHPLKVIELDMERNQLILEDTKMSSLLSKIEHFQNSVSSELDKRSKSWIDDTTSTTVVKLPLQPWLKSGKLTLYLSDKPELLSFYIDGIASVISDKTVKPGDMIRAVVKIQGISLQMSEDDVWTGKSRIQHHILQLYKVNPSD